MIRSLSKSKIKIAGGNNKLETVKEENSRIENMSSNEYVNVTKTLQEQPSLSNLQ